MSFEDRLDALNQKTLIVEPPKNEFLHLKRQVEQLRLQHENDESLFKQVLERREREFDYRMKEMLIKERKQYELELKLVREDLTLKGYQMETEKNSQIKQLGELVQSLEEQIASANSNFHEELLQKEQEFKFKMEQRVEQMRVEKDIEIQAYEQEIQTLKNQVEQINQHWSSQIKQDKDALYKNLESQKNQEQLQLKNQFELKLFREDQDHQVVLRDLKQDYEQRLKNLKDQLDAEKSNTQLFRRRAMDIKRSMDQEMDCLKQEHSLILQNYKNELQEERARRDKLQLDFDQYKLEAVQKETRMIEEYTSRENQLRHKLQAQINEMYQKQIEIAEAIENQYKELDRAAERKYEKLKSGYLDLQRLFQENFDKPKVPRTRNRSLQREEDVLNVLGSLNRQKQRVV